MAYKHNALRKEHTRLKSDIMDAVKDAFDVATDGDDSMHLRLRKKFRQDMPDNMQYLRFWSDRFYIGPDYTRMYELDNESLTDIIDMLACLESGDYKEYKPD